MRGAKNTLKALVLVSLIVCFQLVPQVEAMPLGCVLGCIFFCGGNPLCLTPCILNCKKKAELSSSELQPNKLDDQQILCSSLCFSSNCINAAQPLQGKTLTQVEMMACAQGCDASCNTNL